MSALGHTVQAAVEVKQPNVFDLIINGDYQYEDNDIQAILTCRLCQLVREYNPLIPIYILAATDDIIGEQITERLLQEKAQNSGVGGVWAATRAIYHANIGIFGRQWFLPVFLAFTFLFTPKASVWIKDDLSGENMKIDNIPFAIAFFSSLPSTISHTIAEIIEGELRTADNVKSSKVGLMFGAKLVAKFKEIKIQDPILLENAKQFCKQCYMKPFVMGNILGLKKEAEEAPNLLAFINEHMPENFGIYYRDPETRLLSFKDCREATQLITSAISGESKFSRLLANFGSAIGIKHNTAEQLVSRINAISRDTLAILEWKTKEVHTWVKQSMMLNAYRESLDDWREGSGHDRLWPELVSMNATRGLYQQSFGWLIAGEMAAEALPLMQTVVFLLIVCSIFIVFPFAMLPGGMEVLRLWIKLLIWVNVWPIFFAIINALGMQVLHLRSGGWDPNFGLDKLSQGQFSDLMLHTYAMVQLFASSVPILSWMIVSKSGYALVSLTEKLLTTGVGASLGSAAVDNTLNLDSVHIGNRQIAQQHVGPSLNMSSMYDNGMIKSTQSVNGDNFLDERASQLAVNYRGSEMELSALQKGYNDSSSYLDSLNQRKARLDSLEKAQLEDYASRWLSSHDVNDGANERIAKDMRTVASEGYGTTEGYGDRSTKGTETHSKAEIGGGFLMHAVTGAGASNTHDASHDTTTQHSKNFQDSYERVRDYAKSHDDRTSYGKSNTSTSSLQSTWREQEQIAKEHAATSQKIQQYQEQQNYITQHQASIDANWNDRVLEGIQQKHGLSNKQEALTYIHDHYNEGEQVLFELINNKHGNLIRDNIKNQALALQQKVEQNIPNENLDFKTNSDALKAQFAKQTLDDAHREEIEQHLAAGNKEEIEKMVLAEDPPAMQNELETQFKGAKQTYDNTNNSTMERTAHEVWENANSPPSGYVENTNPTKE